MSSSHEDIEKPSTAHVSPKLHAQDLDLDRLGETEGYVLSANTFHLEDQAEANLKLAQDGKTILIPHPSDDPTDPLSWSQVKKHVILLVASACAFLPRTCVS